MFMFIELAVQYCSTWYWFK